MSIRTSFNPLGTLGAEYWVEVPAGMTVQEVTGRVALPRRIRYIGATAPTSSYKFIASTGAANWPAEIFIEVPLTNYGATLQCGIVWSKKVHFLFPNGAYRYVAAGYSMSNGAMQHVEEVYLEIGGNGITVNNFFTNSWAEVQKISIKMSGGTLGRLAKFSSNTGLAVFELDAPSLRTADLGFLGNSAQGESVVLSALRQLPTRATQDGNLTLYESSKVYSAVHTWLTELGIEHSYTAGSAPVVAEGQPLPKGWTITYTT